MTSSDGKVEPERRRLNVVHACAIRGRGGSGYMASRVARLQSEAGHRVHVAARQGSRIEAQAREDGLPLLPPLRLRWGFRPVEVIRDLRVLRGFLRTHSVDIIHTWSPNEYSLAGVAVMGTATRLVRTRARVTPVSDRVVNRALHRRTAAVFVTCRSIEKRYREAGWPMENVFPLKDGVDVERFRPGLDGEGLRAELGLGDGAFVLACVSRLEEVKGHETLLRALARLPDRFHALLAGKGSRRGRLEEEARRLGVDGRARFLGQRDDVPRLLGAADAYVLCSLGSEGSSRATLEAMACRLPCVTTDVGMLPDIVRDGETGLLLPPGDAGALARGLETLAANESLRSRLADSAYRMVMLEHTEQHMARRIEDVYYRILGS